MPIETPNPDLAIKMGCTCPVLDNGHGRGGRIDFQGRPQFWISEDCKLHDQAWERNRARQARASRR